MASINKLNSGVNHFARWAWKGGHISGMYSTNIDAHVAGWRHPPGRFVARNLTLARAAARAGARYDWHIITMTRRNHDLRIIIYLAISKRQRLSWRDVTTERRATILSTAFRRRGGAWRNNARLPKREGRLDTLKRELGRFILQRRCRSVVCCFHSAT